MFDCTQIDPIIEKRLASGGSALAVLADIQKEFHYLPDEIFPYVAEKLSADENRLRRDAATFSVFSTQSSGKYVIRVCSAGSCTTRGRKEIVEAIRETLGLSETETTSKDGLFSLEMTGCLGLCAKGPVITIGEERYTEVTKTGIAGILRSLQKEK